MPAAPRFQAPEIETIRRVVRHRSKVVHNAAHTAADLPIWAYEKHCSPVAHKKTGPLTTRSSETTAVIIWFSIFPRVPSPRLKDVVDGKSAARGPVKARRDRASSICR